MTNQEIAAQLRRISEEIFSLGLVETIKALTRIVNELDPPRKAEPGMMAHPTGFNSHGEALLHHTHQPHTQSDGCIHFGCAPVSTSVEVVRKLSPGED